MSKKNYHVVPRGDGWAVKGTGNERATRLVNTQAETKIDVASRQHKTAVVNAILNKHDAATHSKRFNAVLATASINDAIEYYELFKKIRRKNKRKMLNSKP